MGEWYNSDFYHVFDQDSMELIGYVTSAWYSPAQGCNIAMAMLPNKYTEIGSTVGVALPNRYKENDVDPAEVCVTPFKQPPKGNEGTGLWCAVQRGSWDYLVNFRCIRVSFAKCSLAQA